MDADDFHDLIQLEQLAAPRIKKSARLDAMKEYNDVEFRQRYHLDKNLVHHLHNLLYPRLKRIMRTERGLTVMEQLLITLRFLASGSFQIVCGDTLHVSQASVSRCISQVIKAIITLRDDLVCFPNDMEQVKHQFYEIANFPGIIGLVDGTHIPICKPVGIAEPEIYRSRKGFYSLNVQLVCGPNMKIYNVVARWPGSTHDNRIFENSRLHFRLSHGHLQGIILGDGGYGNKR
jgi:hypothetical protein